MNAYLASRNFPSTSKEEDELLSVKLESILQSDLRGNPFTMFANYQRILADNLQKASWPLVHEKLQTLFQCGHAVRVDGPMIGIPVSIRDSDYFRDVANLFGEQRSVIANIEWMASAWNATFADTGLWMGKTFEPISSEAVDSICKHDSDTLSSYNYDTTRIGRNFFRPPPNPNLVQSIGLPGLRKLWNLQPRPQSSSDSHFMGELLPRNLEKEKNIPYTLSGGIFLANMGQSVVPEMRNKEVYQLNYRWDELHPAFPMTRLIDEIVQVADGIYLGQLVFATQHFNLGHLQLPFDSDGEGVLIGERYLPKKRLSWWQRLINLLLRQENTEYVDYGYQNNGYFLMMDPAYAKQIYADDAFPQLRPRIGESGFVELGYDKLSNIEPASFQMHVDWQHDEKLKQKFTTLTLENSPVAADNAQLKGLLQRDETVLQMLKRVSNTISAQTRHQDRLEKFETLNRLFRCGVAPGIKDGMFQGATGRGYNTRLNSQNSYDWYGESQRITGFDYYHGATLNLHGGIADNFRPQHGLQLDDSALFPSALAELLKDGAQHLPNAMDLVWRAIGKYVFPWAGKSFEKISPRTLSMLLDESDDLALRYPQRVHQLQTYLASAPHYELVKQNARHRWSTPGRYAEHLKHGSWDLGMTEDDKDFWREQADKHWVQGNNLQDKRILASDALLRIIDMNYKTPDPLLQAAAEQGPSPFVREGYMFLGCANQSSILPMNSSEEKRKKVFQFHYRYPMIGGPVPIGYCLDELVQIAEGLYLGQLIYATNLSEPFQSAQPHSRYCYQLFGYFLLLDNDWEQHRQAIGLDVLTEQSEGGLLERIVDLIS